MNWLSKILSKIGPIWPLTGGSPKIENPRPKPTPRMKHINYQMSRFSNVSERMQENMSNALMKYYNENSDIITQDFTFKPYVFSSTQYQHRRICISEDPNNRGQVYPSVPVFVDRKEVYKIGVFNMDMSMRGISENVIRQIKK